MTVQPTRDQLRALANAATPGPWERGNWYHVQASTHCMCSQGHGPLVGIDPHGSFGEMHVHRYSDAPLWNEGIRARDDATGGVDVVVESDEYGTMSDADAEFIAAARTALPALLDALAAAEAERDEWKALALQERGAALDTLGQIKARDARIKAVRDVLDQAEASINRHPAYTFSGQRMDPIVNGADIRRALESDTPPRTE